MTNPNPPQSSPNRRDLLRGAAAAAAGAAVPGLLAGCTEGGRAGPRPAPVLAQPALAPLLGPAPRLAVRRSDQRGRANHGWLDTRHSFSFASYYDPDHMGFRSLRVINEDVIAGGEGFPMHPHRDMEILTYVLSGALEHRDSIGNGGVIRPGEVQRMSAGTGIRHSEVNPSREAPVHLLQIWIEPSVARVQPSYDQREYTVADRTGRLRLVASGDGRDGAISIHQDADVRAAVLPAGGVVDHVVRPGRHAWLQVARGALDVNGTSLAQGDGVAVSDPGTLRLRAAAAGAEVLVFDLA